MTRSQFDLSQLPEGGNGHLALDLTVEAACREAASWQSPKYKSPMGELWRAPLEQ